MRRHVEEVYPAGELWEKPRLHKKPVPGGWTCQNCRPQTRHKEPGPEAKQDPARMIGTGRPPKTLTLANTQQPGKPHTRHRMLTAVAAADVTKLRKEQPENRATASGRATLRAWYRLSIAERP